VNELRDKDNEHLQKLNSKLQACREVVATLETPGWKKIIQPIIDKMIIDIVGGRDGDYWDAGQIKREIFKDYKVEHMLGYRQSLVDLHNRIWGYKAQIKSIEQKISSLKNKQPADAQPMQGGRYAPDKDKI
jgi:uncharacterized coiled-coil DUF342 family protein